MTLFEPLISYFIPFYPPYPRCNSLKHLKVTNYGMPETNLLVHFFKANYVVLIKGGEKVRIFNFNDYLR